MEETCPPFLFSKHGRSRFSAPTHPPRLVDILSEIEFTRPGTLN
jgi:hypothetical protein